MCVCQRDIVFACQSYSVCVCVCVFTDPEKHLWHSSGILIIIHPHSCMSCLCIKLTFYSQINKFEKN